MGEGSLVRLTNASGAYVELSSLGAGIVSIHVPDKYGRLENVVLGYANPVDYLNDGPCSGKVPGRYANRIARGHFTLEGKEYTLAINNGPNHLHGGPTGFQNRLWDCEVEGDSVVFSRTSPDGEEGYPGTVKVEARYTWTDDNTLLLNLRAHSDAPTVINLTNHCYFNLDGEGSALDHLLQLNAAKWLPTDETLIPTGEFAEVEGTPMDFRQPKTLGKDIKQNFPALKYGKGYDNCWVLAPEAGTLRCAAILRGPKSGRALEVITDQPAVQVYTGNWLEGSPRGARGEEFQDYDFVAIECQDMPDAPNHPDFPSTVLEPGQLYNRNILFNFKTI